MLWLDHQWPKMSRGDFQELSCNGICWDFYPIGGPGFRLCFHLKYSSLARVREPRYSVTLCELDSGGGESESCFCVIICSGALFYLRTFYPRLSPVSWQLMVVVSPVCFLGFWRVIRIATILLSNQPGQWLPSLYCVRPFQPLKCPKPYSSLTSLN